MKRFGPPWTKLRSSLSSRIRDLEGTISELTRSLEFTQAEMHGMKHGQQAARKRELVNKATVDGLVGRAEEMAQRLNYQEYSSTLVACANLREERQGNKQPPLCIFPAG